MLRTFCRVLVAGVAACVAAAGPAAAQSVTIDITGLPPGSALEVALSAANLNKTSPRTQASSEGTATVTVDFENLGRPAAQSNGAQELFGYWDHCEDPPVLLFSDVPRDDRECRDPLGAFFFRPGITSTIAVDITQGAVQADSSEMTTGSSDWTGLHVYGGTGGARFPSAETSPTRVDIGGGFTQVRESADLSKSAKPSFILGADYWFSEQVAGFVNYHHIGDALALREESAVEAEGVVLPGARRMFQTSVTGFRSVDYGAKIGGAIGPVHLQGIVGARTWNATADVHLQDFLDTTLLAEVSDSASIGGTNLLYGTGANVRLTDRLFVGGTLVGGKLRDSGAASSDAGLDEKHFEIVGHVGFRY